MFSDYAKKSEETMKAGNKALTQHYSNITLTLSLLLI